MRKLKRSYNRQCSLVALEHSIVAGNKEINLSRFCACNMDCVKRLETVCLYKALRSPHNAVIQILICVSKMHH